MQDKLRTAYLAMYLQILINIFMFLILLIYANYLKIKKMDIQKDKFEGKLFNLLYLISYSFPINVFVKESRVLNKREKKIKKKIQKLDLDYKFNLRSFMAIRFLLLFLSLYIFFAIVGTIKYYKGDSFNILANFHYIIIALLIPYIPDIYLKKKEREYQKFFQDEVIVLQLFMILLIKSNSTIEDILFAFSKMRTYYKKSFEKAYRMSLRDKTEALNYLEAKFKNSAFGDSFNVLKNMYQYSREDTVRILQANLRKVEKEGLNQKRRKELTKFSFSQVSVIVPFLIVVFLGAIPFIHYAIHVMVSSIQGI